MGCGCAKRRKVIVDAIKNLFRAASQNSSYIPLPEIEVERLVMTYLEAKKKHNKTLANESLSRLQLAGVVVEDSPDGTMWRLALGGQ